MRKKSKKGKVGKQLQHALRDLTDLKPDERLEIYRELRASGTVFSIMNSASVFDRKTPIEALTVLKDGTIGLRPPRLFLSHSHADKLLVHKVARRLKKSGISVWMDEAEIRFGDSLIQKLRAAINQVDLVLAFLSEHSIDSEWVQRELEIATTQEIANRRVKVIPILLGRVALPGFLEGKMWADFSSSDLMRKNVPRLIDSVNAHFRESPKSFLMR